MSGSGGGGYLDHSTTTLALQPPAGSLRPLSPQGQEELERENRRRSFPARGQDRQSVGESSSDPRYRGGGELPSSGLGPSSTAVTVSGSSPIPHKGQDPGPGERTSGCIGHV